MAFWNNYQGLRAPQFDPVMEAQKERYAQAQIERAQLAANRNGAMMAIEGMTAEQRGDFLAELLAASLTDMSDATLKRCADMVNSEIHERIPT